LRERLLSWISGIIIIPAEKEIGTFLLNFRPNNKTEVIIENTKYFNAGR